MAVQRQGVLAGLTGWLAAISLLGLALLSVAPAMPSLTRVPNVDDAIFQYVGQRLREGDLLYRDVFDHKPPLVFLLNALGLSLGDGSRWGIWALQLLAVSAAGFIGYVCLRNAFGALAGWLGAAGFLVNLAFVFEGGNLTEAYALPLFFLIIAWLLAMSGRKRAGWQAFLLGAAAGLASSLKQPLAAPMLAAGAMLFLRRIGADSKHERQAQRGLIELLWMLAGFGVVWAIWFGYFAVQGALADFWDAAFVYNFTVSGIALSARLSALVEGGYFLVSASPFFALAIAGWFAALAHLLVHHKRLLKLATTRWIGYAAALLGLLLVANGLLQSGFRLYSLETLSPYRWANLLAGLVLLAGGVGYGASRLPQALYSRLSKQSRAADERVSLLLGFAVIDLPLEFILSGLSGSNYRHYFMPLLPSLAILAGFLVWSVRVYLPQSGKSALPVVWAGALAIPLVMVGILQSVNHIYFTQDRAVTEAAAYIDQNTTPDESILVWGGYPMIYTTSQRRAPGRIFYVKHLFSGTPASQRYAQEFLGDVQSHPPALILETRPQSQPFFYTEAAQECAQLGELETILQLHQAALDRQPEIAVQGGVFTRLLAQFDTPAIVSDGMPAVYRWMCENYTEETRLGDWVVYRYTPNRP